MCFSCVMSLGVNKVELFMDVDMNLFVNNEEWNDWWLVM